MIKRAMILAGGVGTRLRPLTIPVNKQLLPLYDQPVVSYPLQTLKEMGYVDILLIAGNEEQKNNYEKLLGDGSNFDLNIEYVVQSSPRGLPDAFIVGENFLKGVDEVCLILGDNIFITNTSIKPEMNKIFTYEVTNPNDYGVAIVEDGHIKEIVEKPREFISNKAVVGLYIFDGSVVEEAKKLKPSKRKELEIVDLIKNMDKKSPIKVEELDGFWFDVGSHDSLLDCANLIRTIRNRTSRKLGLDYP